MLERQSCQQQGCVLEAPREFGSRASDFFWASGLRSREPGELLHPRMYLWGLYWICSKQQSITRTPGLKEDLLRS